MKILTLNERRIEEIAEQRHFHSEKRVVDEAVSEISGARSERDYVFEEAKKTLSEKDLEIQLLRSRILELENDHLVAERVAGLAPCDPPPSGGHVITCLLYTSDAADE